MAKKAVRKIVHIDEEKCDGCGSCIPSCAEGALQIIDNKARIVSEMYCDGLGACLGECPQGAITVEERLAPEFDEAATHVHLKQIGKAEEAPASSTDHVHIHERNLPVESPPASTDHIHIIHQLESVTSRPAQQSLLKQWPVQLTLVSPSAPFLKNSDILLAADCVAFAYPDFQRDFVKGHTLLVACPKLDDFDAHLAKLAEVIKSSEPKSLTVVTMEVPCCSGLVYMANEAVKRSSKDVPVNTVTIGTRGDILSVT